MELPEKLFRIVNPVIATLLRSPLHRACSGSFMLVNFTGRKTGRQYSTPVRYLRANSEIRCFTSEETRWWRNLRGGATCSVLVQRETIPCVATVVEGEPARELFTHYLARFPQDGAYYDVRVAKDGTVDAADLARALPTLVAVVLRPSGRG